MQCVLWTGDITRRKIKKRGRERERERERQGERLGWEGFCFILCGNIQVLVWDMKALWGETLKPSRSRYTEVLFSHFIFSFNCTEANVPKSTVNVKTWTILTCYWCQLPIPTCATSFSSVRCQGLKPPVLCAIVNTWAFQTIPLKPSLSADAGIWYQR